MGYSPNVRQRGIAKELVLWRKMQPGDLDQGDVAKLVGWSTAKQSRLELAQQLIKPVDVLSIGMALKIPEGERADLFERCQASMEQGWWDKIAKDAVVADYRDYIQFEADAHRVRIFQYDVVPGLLQTRNYGIAVGSVWTDDHDAVEQGVDTRLQRQGRLKDDDFQVQAILAQSVLFGLGGTPEMREQRQALQEFAKLPGVDIRVLAADAGPPPVGTSFSILSFGKDDPDVGYIEMPNKGVFLEDEGEVSRFRLAFDRLWGTKKTEGLALDLRASSELIAAIDR